MLFFIAPNADTMPIIRHPVIPSAPNAAPRKPCTWSGCITLNSMRMSCDERDEFLSREILKTNPSLITRLTEPHKRYNSREIIAEMNNVIMNLDTENKILSDTVKWMHDTIWELMHEKRESGQGNRPAPGDCGDCRDCGNCMDREPSEECMEVTAHTGQTEAAYSEAAAADMSQTEEAEKGYKR